MVAMASGNSTSPTDNMSEQDWQAIKRHLPVGADQAHVRAELELIKRDKLSSKESVAIFEERARLSDKLARESPVPDEERARLVHDARWSRDWAKFHERMIGEPPKFRRQCAMLWLWQQQGGGDPRITGGTNNPAIRYLQAATQAVFGEPLSAARAKEVIRKFRHRNFSAAHPSIINADVLIDDDKVWILHADGTRSKT